MVPGLTERDKQAAELRRRDLLHHAERERRAAASQPAGSRRAGRSWLGVMLVALFVVVSALGQYGRHPAVNQAAAADLAAAEEINRAVAHRFFTELHDQGDLAVAAAIVAPDAVFHLPDGEVIGPDGIGGLVTLLRTAFPDATFPIEDIAVDGNTVAVRWTMRGTFAGEFQGIPPTGEAITLPGVTFLTIADGLIVADWVFYDQLGLLQQLGDE